MPPKGKRTSSAPEEAFLFVNEDFSTLFGGAKNADLDRSKQSHVQRRSFAKRRKNRGGGDTSSLPTSPTPCEEARLSLSDKDLASLGSESDNQNFLLPFSAADDLWLPLVLDETTDSGIADPQLVSSSGRSQLPYWRPSDTAFLQETSYSLHDFGETLSGEGQPDIGFTSSFSASLQSSIEVFADPEDTFSLSPVASTSSNDPFNNVQTALEKWAPPLIRYYTMQMVPDFFYADLQATTLHNMRHVEFLHQDMRSCMSNPAEMYALLAASASYALRKEGKLDLPDLAPENSNRVILLFKSKALEALRLRLSNGELSRGTVLAIQRLMCAARYVSSLSAVEAHYEAAISMIRTIGGVQRFNDFEKERLIMHDLLHTLETGSPPRLELTWDPGDLAADVNLGLIIHMKHQDVNPGQRIRSIVEDSELALHPVVAKCILELVETQNVLEWLRERAYRPAEYKWLAHRRLANLHRLLNIDKGAPTDLFEVVRLVLLYYCIMARVIPYNNMVLIDKFAISELERWEARAMEDTFSLCTDLLLWVIVVFSIGMSRPGPRGVSPDKTGGKQSSPQERDSRHGSGEAQNFKVPTVLVTVGRSACEKLDIKTEAQLRGLMKTMLFDQGFVDDRYLAFATYELSLKK